MSRRVKHAVNDLRQRLAKRGVTLAPSVLLLLCARNAAEAAPAALMGQLGKMAMVSGAATKAGVLSAANCIPSWALSIPSPLKIAKVAAREWPRISLCAAVGLGLYLAVPYYPVMRFLSQNRPQPATVRDDVRPSAAAGASTQPQTSPAAMPQPVP